MSFTKTQKMMMGFQRKLTHATIGDKDVFFEKSTTIGVIFNEHSLVSTQMLDEKMAQTREAIHDITLASDLQDHGLTTMSTSNYIVYVLDYEHDSLIRVSGTQDMKKFTVDITRKGNSDSGVVFEDMMLVCNSFADLVACLKQYTKA